MDGRATRLVVGLSLVLLACLHVAGLVGGVHHEAAIRRQQAVEASRTDRSTAMVALLGNERRDWLRAASAHGLALALVAIIALLLVRPLTPTGDRVGGAALRAYEEAMGRLQAHGDLVSRQHDDERRKLRSQLDDKDAMARAGELTAGIVHEVRNGLGTIAGYAQLIERAGAPEEAVEAVRQIRAECVTLETVVRRFVDFVRNDQLVRAPLDVPRMLRRVSGREVRAYPGVSLELPAAVPVEIVGDEEMLERAFENLVRNACQAAGPSGHVWVAVEVGTKTVQVSIADDGPGMPADKREEIKPFASSKKGLGLGLPMVLKIVRLHGGELLLEERSPEGLVVTVRLPVDGEEAPGAQS